MTINGHSSVSKNKPDEESNHHYSHQSNALQILYGMDLTGHTAVITGATSGVGKSR
jgi:hypothetical protein